MRHAIYFTPPADDPLTQLAAEWLGRDAYTGQRFTAPSIGALSASEQAFHTAQARRYGFHGTLKASFLQHAGATETDMLEAAELFSQMLDPVFVPEIRIERLGGFFALTPANPSEELNRLAKDVVIEFDRFRAPLTEAEIERRDPHALSVQEQRYLHQWGYPYIFDRFRFHMTLTGRIESADVPRMSDALNTWFAEVLDRPLAIASLVLFVEPEPGAPFEIRETFRLTGATQRKTA